LSALWCDATLQTETLGAAAFAVVTGDSRGAASALNALRRKAGWVLAFAALVAAGVYAMTMREHKTYEATASVQITPGTTTPYLADDQTISNLYLVLAQSSQVKGAAASRFGLAEREFAKRASATAEEEVPIIDLSATASQPSLAATYAAAYADSFVNYVTAEQSQAVATALQPIEVRIASVESQLSRSRTASVTQALQASLEALQGEVAATLADPRDSARILQPAVPPTAPYSPRPGRTAALAFVLALALASLAVVLLARRVDRYDSLDDAAVDLDLPILASIPRGDASGAAVREAFRTARVNLLFERRQRGDDFRDDSVTVPVGSVASGRYEAPSAAGSGTPVGKKRASDIGSPGARSLRHGGVVVLVTGSESGAGKSYVSSNLAQAIGDAGHSVLLIDGDLRRPALHERFALARSPGLGDALTAQGDQPAVAHHVTAAHAGHDLYVVAAGEPTDAATELLGSPHMGRLMQGWSRAYDVIVIDSPPVTQVVDPLVLARYSDTVLVVVDSRLTRRTAAHRAVDTLRALDLPLGGVIFNRYTPARRDRRYGYSA
jgi:capsular exopolysaccharide synthesis family protein